MIKFHIHPAATNLQNSLRLSAIHVQTAEFISLETAQLILLLDSLSVIFYFIFATLRG
jgi:hypothetical protein